MTNPLQQLVANFWKMSTLLRNEKLADVWMNLSPGQSALDVGVITNNDLHDEKVRLCFRNYTDRNLLLCWMDDEGTPHHFYKLKICRVDEDAPVTENDHLEQSFCGHAFGLYEYDEDNVQDDDEETARMPPSVLLEPNTRLIGGYRPLRSKQMTVTRLRRGTKQDESHNDDEEDDDEQDKEKRFPCHLICIETAQETITCRPCKMLRGSSPIRAVAMQNRQAADASIESTLDISISSKLVYLDPTPIDTTIQKLYCQYLIANWPVFMTQADYKSLTKGQKLALETDLSILQECLPEHASKALRCNTPLYVNKSLKYGPALCPQKASGMCFHPGIEWLAENGLHRQKVECVEMYSLAEYLKERNGFWQPGGLLLHEYSHAYHYKMLTDGYDNATVKECYDQAMRDKLYDAVHYHKMDGTKHSKPTRAYACTDQMEYFAELSVAFLGGLDDAVEFNKWFPFNRSQLKQHDPRAFAMLKKVWKMDDLTLRGSNGH
ncbi:hypothetical protein MPSEU_000225200 [Mayamaea pseudoterrestris]|nr:hypothetical protein MPSEU_000225200 [Mayamaea pseudoterrestris]